MQEYEYKGLGLPPEVFRIAFHTHRGRVSRLNPELDTSANPANQLLSGISLLCLVSTGITDGPPYPAITWVLEI